MKSIWVGIQVAFSALGGFLGWYLGGVDGFLYALIAFVLVDYITGVMCAIVDKKLSSAVGFKGICRKVGDLLLPVQRRHLFSGERRAPGPAHPGKAEGRAGTTA